MLNSSQISPRGVLSAQLTLVLHIITAMTFFAAASAPTPLYRLYQQLWHFSSLTLTLIFATYAFSLLFTLIIAGALSDYIGRRPVILMAIVLQIVSMALFLSASDVSLLILARFIQGIATGLAMTALSAAILDLNQNHGTLINSLYPMVGMAVGMLMVCLVLQFSGLPLLLTFEILLGLLIVEGLITLLSPETTQKRQGAWASLKPGIALPEAVKATFWQVSPVNISIWMLGGFYLSLMPSLLAAVFPQPSPWLNGIAFMLLTLMGALAILMLRHKAAILILLVGTINVILGPLLIIIGVNLGSALVLLIGCLLAGIGFGSGFMGALRSVMALAQPDQRAQLMSIFYIESYLTFSLPAIAAGYLIHWFGIITTANLYGTLIIILASVALYFTYKNTRKTARFP